MVHRCLAFLGALAALALGGCAHAHQSGPSPTPSGSAPLLLDSRGIMMPLGKAVRNIGFRPLVPTPDYLAVAVIPPLGNDDSIRTRGIAFEYVGGGRSLVLSEWPEQQFRLQAGPANVSSHPCQAVPYGRATMLWTTKQHLAMTLQGDGSAPPGWIEKQAQALAARACS